MSLSHAQPAPSAPLSTRLRLALADIKVAHSVFALPFAVLAAFLATPLFASEGSALAAAGSTPGRFAGQAALVVACMVTARTWAMLVNRLADRRFDAANPRTTRRALASGALPLRDGLLLTAASAAVFLVCCGLFLALYDNPWPLVLAAPTLVWIALYSFTKRFTALCHLFLGGALAASPLAAAIAVEPAALWHLPALWALAAMVVFWVAGFDVLYALQDVEFDRSAGLFSLPSRLGPHAAVWISRGFHTVCVSALVAACVLDTRLGPLMGAGVILASLLLMMEHLVLRRRGVEGLPLAFFTLNGVVSLLIGVLGVADVVA